ncbi:unnamed protein product [Clavelina lepadiformis]|uniref:Tetraspanin-31 n=1 Tax=Clavelina lepadiformis TaxID=159417 RepID=A0ABP0FU66_CLALP
MCGGYTCSKNLLAFLNVLFLLVSFLLIGVAAYAKASAKITSIELAGGIIASGLFLFAIAVLGLIAGSKHHQVLLFFYVVILFLLFIVQFSVSIACLAFSEAQVRNNVGAIWTDNKVSNATKTDAENYFHCCAWKEEEWQQIGNKNSTILQNCIEDNICKAPATTPGGATTPEGGSMCNTQCCTCSTVIPEKVSTILEATGGIGLFFSFTEMLGVWLAVRFRNQKDPRANPNQFL